MPENRPPIPTDLKRRVLLEAGHKCAVPTCGQTIVEIAHIDAWSKVKKHDFGNLIALCPNCHTRFDKGEIDRKSMIAYKTQLSAGSEFKRSIHERIERLEGQAAKGYTTPRTGFAVAVACYRNRACQIGFLDGKRFITVGIATFVRPRVAIVPGAVLEMIETVLTQRGDRSAVWEPGGMSGFRVISPSNEYGNLRLIELGPVPTDARDLLSENHSAEEVEGVLKTLEPNETPLRAELGPYIGDHLGFLSIPDTTEGLRGAGEFQFQDAFVSFAGNPMESGVYTGFLTPILSTVRHSGAPLFKSDGTLVGLVTDIEFVEGEGGCRPVFTTLLGLPELWKTH